MPVDHAGNLPCTPTRFPGGLNTSPVYSAMSHMGQLDPTKWITDFDDFLTYLASDWTITLIGAGGTKALASGYGGILSITNSALAPDATSYQRVQPAFTLAAGKRAFFKIAVTADDASLAAFQAGLIIQDTTPLDATDGIYFQKDAGATAIQAFVRKDATTGSNTNANIGTFTTAKTVFAWAYNGKSTVEFFINDVLVAKLDASSTYLPDSILALSFSVGNGSAVARNLLVDYVFAAQER